ncbi:MAG: hypothetical protein QW727_01065 [Candidatus Pacearchaeota archaeon]
MKEEILNKTKKKKLIQKLGEDFGISHLNYLIIKSGKDKYRIYSGSLSKEELNTLAKNTQIELIGTRLGTWEKDGFRISFDSLNIPEIKNEIKKNIVEISDEKVKNWLKGEDLQVINNITPNTKFVVIKNKDDFLGLARNQGFLKNYIPKYRRIK